VDSVGVFAATEEAVSRVLRALSSKDPLAKAPGEKTLNCGTELRIDKFAEARCPLSSTSSIREGGG